MYKMEQCHICGFTVNSNRGGHLTMHYVNTHNYTKEDAVKQINYFNKGLEFPKCPYCGKDRGFRGNRPGVALTDTCGSEECLHKHIMYVQIKTHQDHPEYAENARRRRVEYLSKRENRVNTAWYNRSQSKNSYLERWFIDNIVIPYNLNDKYDIISEYAEYPYFIDFAFVNIKLDVELDGRCHFVHGMKRIEHDIKRDNELTAKGWKVYRISFKDVEYEAEKTIENFISFINNHNKYEPKKYDYNEVIKYSMHRKNKNDTKVIKREIQKKAKEKQYKIVYYSGTKQILESGINLQKTGWRSKCIKLLNTTKSRFTKFLKNTDFISIYNCEFISARKGSLNQRWITDKSGKRKRIHGDFGVNGQHTCLLNV